MTAIDDEMGWLPSGNIPLGKQQTEEAELRIDATPAADPDGLLQRFAHFGVELGLERIQRLLADLGQPQRQVPMIHVAGSNGKGSVCAYLSSVLSAAGYRVGRYTSPHLVDWCERICINRQPIAPAALNQTLQQVIAAIQPDQPSPTQFEVITATAWLYFAQQQVDVAVMEVGLGGRLDATNVCDRPLVSVITSLSLEHWQRLGPTLTHIATEKAGILKPHCPAVIAPQHAEAEAALRQRIDQVNCPAVWVQPATDVGDGWACYLQSGSTAGPIKYQLPLPGQHQLTNSALAIAALQALQQQGWLIETEAIAQGIAQTRWQGRLQWFTWRGQPLLIDGAHNPAAAAVLRQYVDQSQRVQQPIHWVMGMLSTKDHREVLQALLRPGDRLYLVPVPDHLTASPDELAVQARGLCPDLQSSATYPDVIPAIEAAMRDAAALSPQATPVLCGSLYLVGHFFRSIATV